jgi:hypothetical protein
VNPAKSREAVDALLASRGVRVVSFPDWKRLDQIERDRGKTTGKVRDKFTRVADMLESLK